MCADFLHQFLRFASEAVIGFGAGYFANLVINWYWWR